MQQKLFIASREMNLDLAGAEDRALEIGRSSGIWNGPSTELDLHLSPGPELWAQWLRLAAQEIRALVPREETLILVDEDRWGDEAITGRHIIPFLEQAGQYWGPPPNDDTAIGEFERLRKSGASFIVFAWPAFWWLDYYSGLRQHLLSQFRRVLENERLVVFDLRP